MQLSLMNIAGPLSTGRWGLLGAVVLVLASALPVEAQYFGRNKVQYDSFDFEVL